MHACVSGSLLFTYSRLEMRHSNLVSKCSFAHALFSIFVVSTDDMFSSLFAETLLYGTPFMRASPFCQSYPPSSLCISVDLVSRRTK
jgi:hypothetical protein